MIEIKNLTKRYQENLPPVLDKVSLNLPERGLCYMIGKSGAGKSTLINLIGLMDEEYEGSIRVHSKELSSLNEKEKADYRFKTVSFVFQSYHAQDMESVKENLMKTLSITSLSEKEKLERIRFRLKQLSLEDKENVTFKNLSGGEKKRISLIRALIKDSEILLCDEPLSSLNPMLRRRVSQILKEESKKKLVLVITHEKDEIPLESSIYELRNGKIYPVRQYDIKEGQKEKAHYQRIPFQGRSLLRQLFSCLKAKREYLLITLFSLIIGLFSISFSFQLSSGVSSAMEASMSRYMDENCMVISPKENTLEDTKFVQADYQSLMRIKRNHEDDIIDIFPFYLSSMDTLFGANQRISLLFKDKAIDLSRLSLNSFLEYRHIDEVDVPIYAKGELSLDDIILSLDEERMKALYLLLFDDRVSSFDERHLERLSERIYENPLSLRIQANKASWGYEQDYSYKIKGIVLDKDSYIVSDSNLFSSHFVTDVMHFKEILESEEAEVEWTMTKCDGFRLKKNHGEHFFKAFLRDRECNPFSLKMVKTSNYYRQEDLSTHNHVAVVKDYMSKIHLDEIESFLFKNQGKIQSVSYSSPVYTYTANGYISGFAKPFFFSKYKEKLNQIQDKATFTKEDLGSFQGSQIEDIPGVIKADLISSMDQKKALRFKSIQENSKKPFFGKEPKDYTEIGISRKMAESLFQSTSGAINRELCTLTLDKTSKVDGRYKNHFSQGQVKIVGIYEYDELAIYQDSLFPLGYCFLGGELSYEELRISQAVIKVDLTKADIRDYEKSISEYGNYKGSFPMYIMVQEIKNTLNLLANLFLGFAIISLLGAGSLLFLSLYLILYKDRKEIGILLSLGYEKKEISRFYLSMSQVIGILSFLGSLIVSILTETVLKNTLNELLDNYVFSIKPFLISFLTSMFLTTFIGICLNFRIKSLSPKDAFDKRGR